MHIKAAEALHAVHDGKLPLNLKFLIEGEEEIGGASISKFVAENPAKLKADVALVSDTQFMPKAFPLCASGCAAWSTWNWKPPGRIATCTPASTAAPPQPHPWPDGVVGQV